MASAPDTSAAAKRNDLDRNIDMTVSCGVIVDPSRLHAQREPASHRSDITMHGAFTSLNFMM